MKKAISLTLIMLMFFSFIYVGFEPGISSGATGPSPQTDDIGVTVDVTADISISSPADPVMEGAIYGVQGGSASSTAGTTWTVTTTNATGYTLTIGKTTPLQKDTGGSGKEFSDYPNGSPPDYSWADPGDGQAYWGFYVTGGDDVITAFKQSGEACAAEGGAPMDNGHCFEPVPDSGSPRLITNRSTATPADTGATTTVKFKAAAGTNSGLETGTYTTNIVATATVNPE